MKRNLTLSVALITALFLFASSASCKDVSGVPSGIERDNLHNLNPVRPVVGTPPEWAQDLGLKKDDLESYIRTQLSKANIPTASISTASAEDHKGGTLIFGISGKVVDSVNKKRTAYLVAVSLQVLQRVRLESDNRLSVANTWAYNKFGIYGTAASAATNIQTNLDILLTQFISDYHSANDRRN